MSTLYALGLGPGDPDLMTVRARDVLQRVPTLCVPVRRRGAPSYAAEIIRDLIDPSRQRIETLPFPEAEDGWRAHVERIVGWLADGDVAFLTEGDPLLYSTFIGVLHELRQSYPEVHVCIVPGVASPLAAAALAEMPLADDDQRLAVLPAMYAVDTLGETLRQFDAVVLLKVSGVLDSVLDRLEPVAGCSVVHVRRVGRPEQSVVVGVDCIRAAPGEVRNDYLSLLLITRGGIV